jgi:3-hydroxyacyl-CoA dehydrogenase/enoyl-CoA hydratase/3-hydroxybutyryl-CoA epimerase
MFEEGVSIERIDTLLTQFGLPMGPFVLADEVGIDVATKVSKILEEGYGPRMKMPAVFGKVVEKELFGKKTGKGFYIHKKPRVINRQVVKMQKEERSRGSELTDQQVVDRAILVMVNEAARCLEEGVIETPHYLDLAIIYGTGFPPFRGGLLRYADQRGVDRVADTLDELSKRHGERVVPCDLLVRMREEGKQFYQ